MPLLAASLTPQRDSSPKIGKGACFDGAPAKSIRGDIDAVFPCHRPHPQPGIPASCTQCRVAEDVCLRLGWPCRACIELPRRRRPAQWDRAVGPACPDIGNGCRHRASPGQDGSRSFAIAPEPQGFPGRHRPRPRRSGNARTGPEPDRQPDGNRRAHIARNRDAYCQTASSSPRAGVRSSRYQPAGGARHRRRS